MLRERGGSGEPARPRHRAPLFQTLDIGSVHLRTAEGADVAATITSGAHGSAVVVPAAPLVPGAAYRLEGDSPCPYGPATLGATFTASAPLPLPRATGLLEAGPEQQGVVAIVRGAQCSADTLGSALRLRFTPAPELVPFLPWVHWTMEVDGEPWTTAPHGSLGPAGESTDTIRLKYTRDLLLLHTVCEVPSTTSHDQDLGLEPGRHVATLRPVLEHLDRPLPSVEVPFELTCPKEPSRPRERAARRRVADSRRSGSSPRSSSGGGARAECVPTEPCPNLPASGV